MLPVNQKSSLGGVRNTKDSGACKSLISQNFEVLVVESLFCSTSKVIKERQISGQIEKCTLKPPYNKSPGLTGNPHLTQSCHGHPYGREKLTLWGRGNQRAPQASIVHSELD
ncbi:hypothetical protein J6590_049576 [Homalodisca vitripennis]|nr:hypothetical protein J6590_049576 [Homalodisca vitripennis]